MRPQILLCPGEPNWSYHLTAQALIKHLSHRFDFEVGFRPGEILKKTQHADLILEFWWGGRMEQRHGLRVIKQVSSHRWKAKPYYLDASTLAEKHLRNAGAVVVPSVRLRDELCGKRESPPLTLAPKGFHPEAFGDYGHRRAGDLRIGWAGSARHLDKRVALISEACNASEIQLADQCLTQGEMPDFYNAIDVITCASDAEGDPRPLIEGMACGCFPVTVDVGIVPELVRHGENGLVVERSVEAFRSAFEWCRANLDFVRDAGRRNAVEMLAKRTWAQVAPAWGEAFDRVLERKAA